jgi:hypothetical protein
MNGSAKTDGAVLERHIVEPAACAAREEPLESEPGSASRLRVQIVMPSGAGSTGPTRPTKVDDRFHASSAPQARDG